MTKPEDEDMDKVRDYYDGAELPLSTLRRVAVNRPGRPQEAFALRLPPEVVEELRLQAESRGIGVTQLVREWVVERLELERRRPSSADPALWERTRAAVEDLLPEIVARVTPGSRAG
ncbi:MAG: hypothetical protein M0Z82_18290 [Actinomycetota bacterium]|nr:hypothetical protein [Actinomycetota bacterium]